VIWYQGETNLAQGMGYYANLKRLIDGWRALWGQGQFPFYLAQVAPFEYKPGGWPAADAKPDMLPKLWEAQAWATKVLPNTKMAITTDVGDVKDIHPRNKYPVAYRLALLALANVYGQRDLVDNGPMLDHYIIEGDRVILHFDHTGSGLTSRDGKPLDWFEIAGPDKRFVKAQAEIVGDTVVVSSAQVSKPVAVRFGWHQVAQPKLINKEGLPALPFRTDRW
jgi:sialate O-acetylesterase